jgi:hypothetical protein
MTRGIGHTKGEILPEREQTDGCRRLFESGAFDLPMTWAEFAAAVERLNQSLAKPVGSMSHRNNGILFGKGARA